ncbi:23S rRNA pseudouridine(955/2504/2580) synthase RluC [Thiohalobacter sp. IOR34]|uniref:23S rRNA pseudouridine(955/2504/2580) synthase RluC n=1 Tax=Thiohalobacter sp. IOR34 TaxID=3057176 RepID=UPI0025AFC5CF|nr:23S rRNA pseudouridine(955/2504/2580) synthase RluC [Thiohalobacter sp. IOR34]WJW76788.1 23S rRNA pseudouridine(955/2504/2580) synthase RluC [Thiohalobacter sp. IOR34]
MKSSEPQGGSRVRQVTIEAEQAGQRIDNFLMRHLKGVPRSLVYRLLRKGQVRVNRGRIKPEYRLQTGDLVRIPPVQSREPGTPPGPGAGQRLAGRILYEDERLLVLDKPSGTAVHGGSGLSFGVIEALRASRPEARFLELVHRLDRETSGCLLIAKRRSELRMLHELLRSGAVEKRYLALLKGHWEGGPRTVDVPLRKSQLRGGERMVRVSADGKAARSRFSPLTRYREATLVEVLLDTGRTHQIRVHAAHLGQPLAGDEKYGDAVFNRRMRELGLRRLFLHAHSLAFTRPESGEEIHVSAPLDDDLRALLQRLEAEQDHG